MTFKPLLAAPADLSKLDYGNLWLSPKLDGIRAIIINGVVMSRSLKPIPNKHVQNLYGLEELEGFDGELIYGEPNSPTVYRDTNSAVMSRDGYPDVWFHAFDLANVNEDYYKRRERLTLHLGCFEPALGVKVVPQHTIKDELRLIELEEKYLAQGYEGVMLRKYCGPDSRYKFGRSTTKEGTLLKLKRFEDAEATVIGFEEEMENGNEATTNALGQTERSSHKQNLVGKGRLGALICHTDAGVEFNIGTGFTAADRQSLWQARESLPGRLVKYKSFAIGVKDKPRFPVFLGWRDPIDTSA